MKLLFAGDINFRNYDMITTEQAESIHLFYIQTGIKSFRKRFAKKRLIDVTKYSMMQKMIPAFCGSIITFFGLIIDKIHILVYNDTVKA